MTGMKEDHKIWLDDRTNHGYLQKYIKHQKTSITKLMKGPKKREQFVKTKVALELLDRKIMVISNVLVLPEDTATSMELQKWLGEQENTVKEIFGEYGMNELNEEENAILERGVHIDNVMETIIAAQKKSIEKKRLNDDVKTQPPNASVNMKFAVIHAKKYVDLFFVRLDGLMWIEMRPFSILSWGQLRSSYYR